MPPQVAHVEEAEFARERAAFGMAALFEAIYDDKNLFARTFIVRLVAIHHPSTRVTVTAELSDHTTQLATADSELLALREVLAKIAAYTGHLLEGPSSVSPAGMRLMIDREPLSLNVRLDTAGVRTIGYGHVLTPSELSAGKLHPSDDLCVRWSVGITEDVALAIFHRDLEAAENVVSHAVRVPLSQCRFDALASFVFSVGREAFLDSSLLRVLNDQQYVAVPAQLSRWVYIAGRKRHSLIQRRKSEALQWLGKTPD